MRPNAIGLALLLCIGAAKAVSGAPVLSTPKEFSIDAGRLGPVAVYAPAGEPGSVVLFVSGAAGWNRGMAGMARQLQSWGALVAGLDVRALQKPTRSLDFENLSHTLARRAGYSNDRAPLLVGYAEGGRVAHAIARSAPQGAFDGLITLGACVDPESPPGAPVPFGTAKGTRWLVLQGALDQVCRTEAVRSVVALDPAAKLVLLPGVGHDFAVEADWLPQLRDAYAKLLTATGEPSAAGREAGSPVADLPLAEVRARTVAKGSRAASFVVLLTGDGGWAGLDQELAGALAQAGVPVVALSSLRYFWRERTAAEAALDLNRIIQHYAGAWDRPQVLLVGYSFGANVLPFLVGQLPRATRQAIRSLSLLAPATHAGFEIQVADWIPGSVPEGRPVRPALEALSGMPILCLGAAGEGDNLCAALPGGLARSVELPGGHHFDGQSATLATEILGLTGL